MNANNKFQKPTNILGTTGSSMRGQVMGTTDTFWPYIKTVWPLCYLMYKNEDIEKAQVNATKIIGWNIYKIKKDCKSL